MGASLAAGVAPLMDGGSTAEVDEGTYDVDDAKTEPSSASLSPPLAHVSLWRDDFETRFLPADKINVINKYLN